MTDAGFLEAKSYLLESGGGDTSLYDHLSEVLLQVLEKKPKNVLESFETISRSVKSERLANTGGKPPQKANIDGPLLSVAKRQIKLFERPEGEDGDANESATAIVPNVAKEQQIFEQCGVGIGREEAVLLQFSIQELAKTVGDSVISLRFWGKILGTKGDYYVVEGTLAEGGEDIEPETESGDTNGTDADETPRGDDDDTTALGELEDVPKPFFKKPPVIPMELGSGGNKHRYWVCSEPSQAWTKLPPVTPGQITVARKIKKLFTGNIAAPVHSYPPFKGTEANLLRAQIARISAATHVSPAGYFAFPDEEPEEEDVPLALETVQDFEGLVMEELGKPEAWAHHSAALLPQGRCQWYSVQQDKDDHEDDEDEDAEEAPEAEEEEPETAPPLLTALVEDQPNDADYGSAWSAKTYPSYAPEVACISSNNWPGAYAIATDRGTYFRNLYVGWGQKHSTAAFVPPAIQSVELEYSKPLECAQDPTVEEEQALEEEREDKEGGDLEDDDEDGDEDDD